MLMRTDQFRELDRLAQQVFGTVSRPTVMPMDAWRKDEYFYVEFDLPGVDPKSIDIDVERNVLTVKAERQRLEDEVDVIAEERPRGVFSRQLFLGDTLATDKIEAAYNGGVLRLRIPVAEEAKPRKVQITSGEGDQPLTAISA